MQFKFKKGDKVRVTTFNDEYFGFGELLTVDENDDVPYCINEEGERYAIINNKLQLVERNRNIFSRFYNWINDEDIENVKEDVALLEERVEELEDIVYALLDKLNMRVSGGFSTEIEVIDIPKPKTKTVKPKTRGKK